MSEAAQDVDRVLGFVVAERHARGRFVRLGPVLDQVLSKHGYPPAIERLLGEALALTALLGSLLKGDGSQLTMQAQTEDGCVTLLVADWHSGALRGHVKFDAERLAALGAEPGLPGLFGKGYLAITFDQPATKERYQGIVPLEGNCLADAVEHYFVQSEQVPSLIRTGFSPDGSIIGGFIVQHLPEGEEGRERLHVRMDHPEWEHVRILSETMAAAELSDASVPLETLIWRLFHDEGDVLLTGGETITKGCRCTIEHIRSVLSRFPASEQAEMADEKGFINVDCAFCSRIFPVSAQGLTV
jgi:molecular chaperone Hsp33